MRRAPALPASRSRLPRAGRVLASAAVALAFMGAALAAPFVPASDAEVVERLPVSAATDPALRAAQSLRRQLAARPEDTGLRVELARRYFDLALAQGDPRFAGQAAGALAPLAARPPEDAAYWTARGLLEQYGHAFDAALDSLARAARLDPRSPEPPGWRAAILMVQARYADARAECQRLAPLAEPLWAAGCEAYARAASGELRPAYEQLSRAADTAPDAPAGVRQWARTRLAEMAIRLQRPKEALAHYRQALATGLTDQFLLASLADFHLSQGQPREALALLDGWERSDILLLRLALAGRVAGDPRAARWAADLRGRFAEAARRGDTLHEWEAARFALEIERQPARALALAESNWRKQREPRDALMLLRAALAANQPQAATPALAWLRESRHEDPALAEAAAKLAAAGGAR